jgi:hypothetical protein
MKRTLPPIRNLKWTRPSACLFLLLASTLMGRAAPAISPPTLSASTLITGAATPMTATCTITLAAGDPAVLPNGVNLVRLSATGANVAILGVMTAGAAGSYSYTFTANETTAGSFQLQCTAALAGAVRRIRSAPATVTVVTPASLTLTSFTLAPNSIPLAVATTVTSAVTVSPAPDPGSVMLQRLDSAGRVLALLGTFTDAGNGVFTLQSTFAEFAVGTVPLRVSATFSGSVNHAFSAISNLTVTGTPPPSITITSPTNLSFLNLSPTSVTGTVSDPAATLVINSVAATVSPTGSFSVSIPLAEGPNILTATATSKAGAAGTATSSVTLDTTPPHVTVTSPPDQFVTTSASISVAGNVNDTVVGTVNNAQAQVTVNGVAGQVANRTFLASVVPLNMGSNTISVVARDQAGNAATTQITVVRQAPAAGQITLVSGNNQTATIGTPLATPLTVSLTNAQGAPAANQTVIFAVTQNNGMVNVGTATPAPTIMATTNAQGQAQATWKLGMRSGAGSDGVQAYAVGFTGTAMFTATASQSTPGMIVVDSGNNQTAAVNQPLPKPLVAVVIDAGNNRLANVPVTFTVQSGGGSFAGQPSATVNTDSDGRAVATLTLGFQEGTSNNLVSTNFTGNTAFPASFTASGRGPGDPAKTAISGIVLDNSNTPIPGVTIRAVLTNVLNSNSGSAAAAATAQTDAKGQFLIASAPVGFVKLLVDGSTATIPGTYPTLDYDLVTVAGHDNSVGQPIFLLGLNSNNKLCVTASTGGGTLSVPEAPGFSLTFGPGQVTFPGGSKTGCVSVTVVHPDKVPMSPGFGQQPRFIVTIQPSGALFNPPAPITLPNVDGLAARAVTEMYSFDHDIGSFVAIGTGTVSDDGALIRSNAGVGVLKAGWHCGGDPGANGTAADCAPCNYCTGNTCVPDPNQLSGPCTGAYNNCFVPGTGSCGSGGQCVGGQAVPDGTTCNSGGALAALCVAGKCTGNGQQCPVTCSSGLSCTIDACINGNCTQTPDPQCGFCAGQPDATACGLCQSGATCSGGVCAGGTPVTNGASCGECMVGGACDGGQCLGASPVTDGTSCRGGGSCLGGICASGCNLQIMTDVSSPMNAVSAGGRIGTVRSASPTTLLPTQCLLSGRTVEVFAGDIVQLSAGACSSGQCPTTYQWVGLVNSTDSSATFAVPLDASGIIGAIALKLLNKAQTKVDEITIKVIGGGFVQLRAKNKTYISAGSYSQILSSVPPTNLTSPARHLLTTLLPVTNIYPPPNCPNGDCAGLPVLVEATWMQTGSDTSGVQTGLVCKTGRCTQTCGTTFPKKDSKTPSYCDLNFDLDSSPPAINVSVIPAPSHTDPQMNSWINATDLRTTGTALRLSFSCTDPEDKLFPDVQTCPASVPVSPSIGLQTVTRTASDLEGNPQSLTVNVNTDSNVPAGGPGFFTVNIDRVSPTVKFEGSTPPANPKGWISASPVAANFSATDPSPGSGLNNSASVVSVDGVPAQGLTRKVAGDGTHSVIATVFDYAGNLQSATTEIKIDTIPPKISYLISPQPNTAGWNNSPATVSFACSDATSGLAGPCPSPIAISTEGADQSACGDVKDNADNTNFACAGLQIDLTPPTPRFSPPSPSPNIYGWNNSDVTIAFNLSDNLSGVDASKSTSSPLLINSEGPTVNRTLTLVDVAGNSATYRSPNIKLDKTAPFVSITSPVDKSTVSTTTVTVTGTVTDATSGVDPVHIRCSNGVILANATLTGSTFSCFVALITGTTTVTVQAADLASNLGNSQPITIYYSPVPPP